MKLTKKQFKEVLNKEHGMDGQGKTSISHSGGYTFKGQQTRQYGDYLYSADRGRFDMYYEAWVKNEGKEDWEKLL